jgi:hypothetical protein
MSWVDDYNNAPIKGRITPFQAATNTATVAPEQNSEGGLHGFLKKAGRSIVHPFAEEGNALLHVPQAIYREIQNKPIDDINQKVFGTSAPGQVAKKVIGDTAQIGATIAPVGKVGNAAQLIRRSAGVGAVGSSGAALGDNASAEDTLIAGVEGAGAGGLLGAGAGLLGKTTGAVANAGANRVARNAATDAQNELAELHAPFQALTKTERQVNDMNGVIQHLKALNVKPTPNNMHATADLVTGSNGIASGTVRQILGNVGKVPIGGIENDVKAALLNEAGQLGNLEERNTAANGVMRSVRNTIQGVTNKGKGSLDSKADANGVLDTIQNFENRIRSLGGTKGGAPANAEARVLQAARDSLEERIAGGGGDKAVADFTFNPVDVAAIQKAVVERGGSPELADHIINGVNGARSLGELRAIQKPFVDASHLAAAADKASGGLIVKAPGAPESDVIDAATNVATNLALGNHYGVAVGAGSAIRKSGAVDSLVQKLGGGASKAKSLGANAGQVVNTPRAAAVLGGAIGQADEEQPTAMPTEAPTGPDIGADHQQLNEAINASLEQQAGGGEDIGFSKAQLIKAISSDPKNANTYLAIYKTINDDDKPKVSATKQKAVAGAKQAQASLGSIEQQYKAAGGGQGRLGGLLANLTGKVGANDQAKAYNDTAVSLAASLYKGLGNTGTITDADQKRIAALIPKTTDTKGEAAAKLAQLEQLLAEGQTTAEDMQ